MMLVMYYFMKLPRLCVDYVFLSSESIKPHERESRYEVLFFLEFSYER